MGEGVAVPEAGYAESTQVVGIDVVVRGDIYGSDIYIKLDQHEAPGPDEGHHVGGQGVVFFEDRHDSLVIYMKIYVAVDHPGAPGGQGCNGCVQLTPVDGILQGWG